MEVPVLSPEARKAEAFPPTAGHKEEDYPPAVSRAAGSRAANKRAARCRAENTAAVSSRVVSMEEVVGDSPAARKGRRTVAAQGCCSRRQSPLVFSSLEVRLKEWSLAPTPYASGDATSLINCPFRAIARSGQLLVHGSNGIEEQRAGP